MPVAALMAERDEIRGALDELPDDDVRVLVDVMRRLRAGKPMRRWCPAIGSLSDAEAAELRQIIEEGCEQVDATSW